MFVQEIIASYRVPFLEQLSKRKDIDLLVISGEGNTSEGFESPPKLEVKFNWKILKTIKCFIFNKKIVMLKNLFSTIMDFKPDIVITSNHKKFIQNYIIILLKYFYGYKVFSYQHAENYTNKNKIIRSLEFIYFKYYSLRLFNGVILYTEFEKNHLMEKGINEKIYYANNTLDTNEIFRINSSLNENFATTVYENYKLKKVPSILFIGRLIDGKKVEKLFEYFQRLNKESGEFQLIVIGDGPMRESFVSTYKDISNVFFLGKIYDEDTISSIMKICKFVFLPGYVGLSIVHSFANGKPFITFESQEHGPEIKYLNQGINGFILKENEVDFNLKLMLRILTDEDYYKTLSKSALETAKKYSIENMVNNFYSVINHAV